MKLLGISYRSNSRNLDIVLVREMPAIEIAANDAKSA